MNFEHEDFPVFYMRVSNVWKDFCIFHSNLLDATFTEYDILLSSAMEELDDVTKIKEEFVKKIAQAEFRRKLILEDALDKGILNKKIDNVQELCDHFKVYEKREGFEYFTEFNELLGGILENLQTQNKRNQIYINKALHSLTSLKEEMAGRKSTEIYERTGKTSRLRQDV